MTGLRRAAAGDARALATLNRFVHEMHVARRQEHFKPTRPEDVAAWFISLLPKPTTLIWIAEQDHEPVGYVLAFVRELPENPFCTARRWCEIDQLAVDPRWRRKGVARALIDKILGDAGHRGLGTIELAAWAFNDVAHSTFRRLGFAPKTIRFERTQR